MVIPVYDGEKGLVPETPKSSMVIISLSEASASEDEGLGDRKIRVF